MGSVEFIAMHAFLFSGLLCLAGIVIGLCKESSYSKRKIEEFSKELDIREMKIRELSEDASRYRSMWQTSRGDYVKIREINQGYYETLQAQKSAAERAVEILRSGFQDNTVPARWNGSAIRGVSELFVRGY